MFEYILSAYYMAKSTIFFLLLLPQVVESLRCHDCWAVHLSASNSSTDLCTERAYMQMLGFDSKCQVQEGNNTRVPACRTSISSDEKATYCKFGCEMKPRLCSDSYGCTTLTEFNNECRLLYSGEHRAMLLCYCNEHDFCNGNVIVGDFSNKSTCCRTAITQRHQFMAR